MLNFVIEKDKLDKIIASICHGGGACFSKNTSRQKSNLFFAIKEGAKIDQS